MSEDTTDTTEEVTQAPLVQDELASLKARADLMGLSYHHAIGAKKLKAQIEAQLNGQNVSDDDIEAIEEANAKMHENAKSPAPETKAARMKRLRNEAGELVRVRVANMNPNKKDYDGEIYTVSNSVVGTFKKYVPFNAENGWHVPKIILNHMQEKKCQIFYTVKAPNGMRVRKGKLIKELNIEILPPLTLEEMKDLQVQQAMAQGG